MNNLLTPITILGAGLVGRMTAWQLLQAGTPAAQLRLIDAGPADASNAAAYVAAAMLAPLAESALAEPPVIAMGLTSLQDWPSIVERLKTQTQRDIFFQQNGTLVVWHGADKAEAQLLGTRLQRNAPAERLATCLHQVDTTGLQALEPSLAQRFSQGMYLQGEGQLEGRDVLDALLQALEQAGVQCTWNTSVAPQDITDGLVIDCRGMGAKASWPQQGKNALRGIRGEVVRVHAPDVSFSRPVRLLHPRYPLYVAPKPNHVFVIGATEIESEDMSPPSVRSALELLSALHSLHPAFGEARILEIRSQCRPTLADNLPRITFDGQRTIAVNGLYRHGFLLAPVVSAAVSAIALRAMQNKATQADWLQWQAQQAFPDLYELMN